MAELPIAIVPIDALVPSDSPRLVGESTDHIRALAESDASWPPIVVHQPTMRVIDGMHRLQAARLRGQDTIEARLYAGNDEDAFVLAVETNIAHGLPLTLADRREAASRIIRSHPMWSDRMIASVTGLSHNTVGGVRRRSGESQPQSIARIGRDGRVRRTDMAARRRIVGRLVAEKPDASLREIARAAGVTASTVRDVRERIRSGLDPVPARQRAADSAARQPNRADGAAAPTVDRVARLRVLKKDPSLRLNEPGRLVLRWLEAGLVASEEWERLIESIPRHCAGAIAELIRNNAEVWLSFADQLDHYQLEQRGRPGA